MLRSFLRACLSQKLIVFMGFMLLIGWGIRVAPFDMGPSWMPRDPIAVDAIPDIGENQQIVFTRWMGRSPQDVEDQVTHPLTTSLLGIPGVKTIRSFSMMGFSTVYVIFDEDIEFYWSRSRILEKLNALPAGLMPSDASPTLGPDATALGQVFWYTLEGRDAEGNPTGGWDLDELRTIQDFNLRYALSSVAGVAEVASVGGFQREFQVEVDPDLMRAHNVHLHQVMKAVQKSNLEVGARTMEINAVEYVVRGRGWVENESDLERAVIRASEDGIPLTIADVAHVQLGPAVRRGALDRGGTEAVGGVVVARYGDNPMAVIDGIKAKIEQIAPGMPRKTLDDGTLSTVTVVPFYDRSGLIGETLATLNRALLEEILVTIMVVVFMVMHLRSSLLISSLLPLAVLFTFIAMKLAGVDANVVALSGIAIAIGTMVDMGIVLSENILTRLENPPDGETPEKSVLEASTEVGSAILTAGATTVVGFLPVFAMTGAEGKLFKPLAFTKTFALTGSVLVALVLIPVLALILFPRRNNSITAFFRKHLHADSARVRMGSNGMLMFLVGWFLANHWEPLGPDAGEFFNLVFVLSLVFGLLGLFSLFHRAYESILRWCLAHKLAFLSLPLLTLVAGGYSMNSMGREFMPQLDEGSFLYMPTTMPHASIGEAMDALSRMDRAMEAIPEVEQVVGKIGRVESPLDPAPVSMVETVIHYKPEYIRLDDGSRVRQWRDHIKKPDDIWDAIVEAAALPGSTSAPKLQPISTRIVMLQSGMRAPMGLKVQGPDLETLSKVALEFEALLRTSPGINPPTVAADRVVGKPYLEIEVNREAASRYGLNVADVQSVLQAAVGGKQVSTTVQGRERYPIMVRYARETRDSIEALEKVRLRTPQGAQIPLSSVAEISYVRGPQMIKTEDTFLTAYVVFDKHPGWAEVEVVEKAREYLQKQIEAGELVLPAGVSYRFAGSWENQVRANATLMVVLPLALALIMVILQLQFRRFSTTLLVFSGVIVAWAGGFMMLWLWGQDWFLDFHLLGRSMRDVFQVHAYNLSIAVWVGFLALFGIATDDGVVMATYLRQTFDRDKPTNKQAVREAVVTAGKRRVRPCLMTTATTLLALLPVLTATGRGADVMVPMAIPSFGGMTIAIMTMFLVPVLYSTIEERRVRHQS